MMMPMLILFDIDGTLLSSEGVGRASMLAAGRELFGDHFTFDGVDVSGRLDGLIWRDLAARNGVELSEEHHRIFRETYGRHLKQNLSTSDRTRVMPGVHALLDALRACESLTLGLLTGNYAETGQMKISAVGIDPQWFPVQAWGDQADHRRGLPSRAMAQYVGRGHRSIDPANVVIIGDTPHDVDCATFNGCRSLAVGTGGFSLDELRAAQPDLAVETLEDTANLVEWIAGSRSPMRAASTSRDG